MGTLSGVSRNGMLLRGPGGNRKRRKERDLFFFRFSCVVGYGFHGVEDGRTSTEGKIKQGAFGMEMGFCCFSLLRGDVGLEGTSTFAVPARVEQRGQGRDSYVVYLPRWLKVPLQGGDSQSS